jgi:hypothetical protein
MRRLPPATLTATAPPRNARRRAARADVKAIVAELRAPVADRLEITLSLLIERADQIYRQAMAAGQFNAAISALKESRRAIRQARGAFRVWRAWRIRSHER